ncbi:helix-turn-helix domain-containing protein [Nitrospirillum bahiense]|uniref:Putative XRE-type DNA-binding protein n=1 Tax=Nitrospirillum amazonense TaxID=28077 RepID=A0A560G240_9PROT|nr:helix-turn-helix transcriptional regulator [Nitrospirillum amazonense]TWB27780.1 putative XRE-type DNA-binding protein [Nitrospirillum amazonense]
MDEVIQGSGNVFSDLSLPDADILLVKAEILSRISDMIEVRKLTQAQAAQILGIDQPKVSALVRGKLSGFTLDRLLRFLNNLDVDVEIRLTPAKDKAHTIVAA